MITKSTAGGPFFGRTRDGSRVRRHKAVCETDQPASEPEARRKDGPRFPARVRNPYLTGGEGDPSGLAEIADAGARVDTELQLSSARDCLHAVTESMSEGLFTLDADGRLIHINSAAEQLLGWTQEELAGQLMHDHTHYRRSNGKPVSFEDRPLNLRSDQPVRLENEIFIRKDASELPVQVTLAPFRTEEGVRGSVVVFSDVTKRNADELRVRTEMDDLSWVGRIRDALDEARFVLLAQPIVEIATGRTVQHELVIRMIDRSGTAIAPGEFLPAAEHYGLIVDIDRWVVRQAFELAGRGNAVEFNLSAHSLAAPGLLDEFRTELERTSADPSLVVVELTETALVEDEQAAALFIERVTALGCKLALDDFGTGYGGFSYLKRLPIDYLKIDIEFVRDLASNHASRHVVDAVVSLASAFGQKTVAEGIEDDRTLRLLSDFGVDYAQGHVIARPRPVDDVFGAAITSGNGRHG